MDDNQRTRLKACGAFNKCTTIGSVQRRSEVDVTFAFVLSWTESPVGQPLQKFLSDNRHCCFFALVHPPGRTADKVMVIGDPNVIPLHKGMSSASEILFPHLINLLKHKRMPRRWFINNPRSERNVDGICLALTLEMLVEVVVNGLQIHRSPGSPVVTGVDGYRELERLEAQPVRQQPRVNCREPTSTTTRVLRLRTAPK